MNACVIVNVCFIMGTTVSMLVLQDNSYSFVELPGATSLINSPLEDQCHAFVTFIYICRSTQTTVTIL